MTKQRFVNACSICGVEADTSKSLGWRLLTQPSMVTCPTCVSKEEKYGEEYFLRGKETGKSLYENYRWMPDLTIPMCRAIVDHCGIAKDDRILDFGCARGYVVRALRELGHDVWGYDISEWATANSDPEIRQYLTRSSTLAFMGSAYDWVIAKDVLEHVLYVSNEIPKLMETARKGLFVVVPLSHFNGGKYTIEDYEKDVTHVQRLNLERWVGMFLRPGWRVEASYRVRGVKENYSQYPKGNGFILCRRIEES